MLSALLAVVTLPAYVPTQAELIAGLQRGDELRTWARQHSYALDLKPNWLGGGKKMWYRVDYGDELRAYWIVDCETGAKTPLFKAAILGAALEKESKQKVAMESVDLKALEVSDDGGTLTFTLLGSRWKWDGTTLSRLGDATPISEPEQPALDEESPTRLFPAPPPYLRAMVQGPQQQRNQSADGFRFSLQDGALKILDKDGNEVMKASDVSRPSWSPKGRYLAGWRTIPGDRRQVHLIQSSPLTGGRAQLRSRFYDLPGDKLDTFELYVFDAVEKTESKVAMDPIPCAGQPWATPPVISWLPEGNAIVEAPERGYQRFRLYQLEPERKAVTTLVDEQTKTFFDTTSEAHRALTETPELVWRSERDGYGHFYLIDRKTGSVKNQITKGPWVTRDILWLDETTRTLCFTANGREAGEDPYYLHTYVVNLDGAGLRELTDGIGTHTTQFSPDRRFLVDKRSMVDVPPTHELRRVSDGTRVKILESANVEAVFKRGVRWPEPFAAKGRDGKTDIYGIVCRPYNFDPKKRYPVIENIYAGPHDSFVPKAFTPYLGMQRLADLGFIVVQIDGMGTRNRGKAFHDVCYKNLADAGFPDRIAWMKALAAKYPSVDITRVGIYGTSAGGQSSTAGLLFHPEFYKVGVSSCGCHDNRMDKVWWNEQWMGYPVGPEYAAQSNITNASKLKGKLLLIVGELDTNVPPESTMRLVDAFQRANKDISYMVIAGADHTDGGDYGDRQRKDFFIRHLLGVNPPEWKR